MTSYAEVECEDTDCGHKWTLHRYVAAHVCPMCTKQQLKGGYIFLEYAESLQQRIGMYVDLGIPDETRDYVEKLCALSNECERIRLQYESNSDYKRGKRLEGFDELGDEYTYLMRTQSFDWELFDIPEFFRQII